MRHPDWGVCPAWFRRHPILENVGSTVAWGREGARAGGGKESRRAQGHLGSGVSTHPLALGVFCARTCVNTHKGVHSGWGSSLHASYPSVDPKRTQANREFCLLAFYGRDIGRKTGPVRGAWKSLPHQQRLAVACREHGLHGTQTLPTFISVK